MAVHIARWGNSLAVRISRATAERAGLAEGAQVEVEARRGRIVISAARPRYNLDDLLKGMTRRSTHGAFDWGGDVGREDVGD